MAVDPNMPLFDWESYIKNSLYQLAEARRFIGSHMARAQKEVNASTAGRISHYVNLMIVLDTLQEKLNTNPRISQVHEMIRCTTEGIKQNNLNESDARKHLDTLNEFLKQVSVFTRIFSLFNCARCGHRLDANMVHDMVTKATSPKEEEAVSRFDKLVP